MLEEYCLIFIVNLLSFKIHSIPFDIYNIYSIKTSEFL